MNKSERLNDLMIYLNGKNTFNLKEIMNKYKISKSTALRDIQSLEAMGMPIYSQSGRNGFYGILPNRLLSPIVFNVDEMYALYFAMLTLSDYQTTPFHLCTKSLKNKFEMCLSNEKISRLRKMEALLSMGVVKHFNESHCLKDILTFAIENKVCEVEYKKDSKTQIYFVQFFDISSSFGQWYSTAYNFKSEKPQVFRCDKIVSVKESAQFVAKESSEFKKTEELIYKNIDAIDFRVEITQKGVDKFYKENYPSMKLEKNGGRFYINGFYNLGEERFIENYFIAYGEQVLSITPAVLRNNIKNALKKLDLHYSEMA